MNRLVESVDFIDRLGKSSLRAECIDIATMSLDNRCSMWSRDMLTTSRPFECQPVCIRSNERPEFTIEWATSSRIHLLYIVFMLSCGVSS